MMSKKLLVFLVWAILAMFLLTACGSNAPKQDAAGAANKVYNLKAGHVLAPDHPYNLGLQKFAEIVAQKSNGRIKVDVFPASQLGNERDLIEGLQMGTVDLSVVSTAPVSNFSPSFLAFDLPYIFKDKPTAYKVMDGEIGQKMLKDLEKNNIVGLAFWENGMFNIMNVRKPLVHPTDMKDMKVRTMENPIHMATFKAFGANAIPMAWGEVYTALQNKTIDAATTAIAVIYTQRMHEVAPFINRAWQFYAPAPLLMSKKTFDAMPDDLKQIVRAASIESRDYMRKLLADNEEKQLAEMKSQKAQIIDVDRDEWAKACVDVVYPQFIPSKISPDLIKQIQAVK